MSMNVSFLHKFSLLAVHKLVSSLFGCILRSQFFLASLKKMPQVIMPYHLFRAFPQQKKLESL